MVSVRRVGAVTGVSAYPISDVTETVSDRISISIWSRTHGHQLGKLKEHMVTVNRATNFRH